MNNHLSKERFAQCFVGGATNDEQRHISECPECRGELERFGKVMASFRNAVRGRIEEAVASQPSTVSSFPARPAAGGGSKWRPALVAAAAILLGVFPLFLTDEKPTNTTGTASAELSPDALMEAVDIHLLRTVPAPLQPAMAVLPPQESTESGGTQ